jgi:hypothetical protein
MKSVSNKNFRENQNTHFTFDKIFGNRAMYEIIKKIVQPDRPRMTILLTCIACWVPKATNTRSGYVMLTVSSLQQ